MQPSAIVRPVAIGCLAAVTALVAGCGGSASAPTPGPSSTSSPASFTKYAANEAGTPQRGGTLNVLGSSDTDYLDPNITYYTIGYGMVREFSRQLYSYQSTLGHTTDIAPDLATDPPQISGDGKTYRVTIKTGAQWNTTPARQVTAADVVRGLKVSCNPAQPFGGSPDFEFLISGMTAFCAKFAHVAANASAIASYVENTDLPGVTVDPSNPLTVVFRLTQPATFFTNMLAMPVFSPRPRELDAYVPASAQEAQHTISDGPYEVASYNPAHEITFVRNGAWQSSTDSLRHAYVDKIIITMNDEAEQQQQELQTGTASADVSEDPVRPSDVPGLIASNNPGLNVQSEIFTNPYIVFNARSPNNGGALEQVKVRQALSYALNRTHMIQDLGGPRLNPPLTHVLPPGIGGSEEFDPYPNDATKARALLTAAGLSHLKLKFLYQPALPSQTSIFQTVQADLKPFGISVSGVATPSADFYTKYLQVPTTARHGVWDLALAGWGPDWYGEAALSFFGPLFDGRVLPPTSSDFGLYDDPAVDHLIDEAKAAATNAAADTIWAKADRQVMADAAFYPITDPNGAWFHAPQVHNYIWSPAWQSADYTNVWLDPGKNGG